MFIYFWEIERVSVRERASRGGAERQEDTKAKAGSRLWAVSTELHTGLEPTNHEIMTWAEVRFLTNRVTQAPLRWFLFICLYRFWTGYSFVVYLFLVVRVRVSLFPIIVGSRGKQNVSLFFFFFFFLPCVYFTGKICFIYTASFHYSVVIGKLLGTLQAILVKWVSKCFLCVLPGVGDLEC